MMQKHLYHNQIKGTYFAFNLTEVPAFEPGSIMKSLMSMIARIISCEKEIFSDPQLATCWNGNSIEIRTVKSRYKSRNVSV